MNLILGAGLSGISCSYHLGHNNCFVLEKTHRAFGHARSHRQDGFVWDEGPHVSFTKYPYVKDLFAAAVEGEFDEYPVKVGNYFNGTWLDHPVQTALYQLPEPLRTQCLESFRSVRAQARNGHGGKPRNYGEWLHQAFGSRFAVEFPERYTRKYWTREATELTTAWIGDRVFYPREEEVLAGSLGPIGRSTHYITTVRYPRRGGYESFGRTLLEGCNVSYGSSVAAIDLKAKQVWLDCGRSFSYTRLINTLPLPIFVRLCQRVPGRVLDAVRALSCSQLLLVNVSAPHETRRPENWIYVYDEDKLSTRISFTEKLTPLNAPRGWTGVQSEVYFSRHRPLRHSPREVGERVRGELVEMGLIDESGPEMRGRVAHHIQYSPWANVIFDHDTAPALEVIWSWLGTMGLAREAGDVHPLTDWETTSDAFNGHLSPLVMAGRFGQWKYFWTDDCVLRGRQLGSL